MLYREIQVTQVLQDLRDNLVQQDALRKVLSWGRRVLKASPDPQATRASGVWTEVKASRSVTLTHYGDTDGVASMLKLSMNS